MKNKIVNNTWETILKQIDSDYEKLKDLMYLNPKISFQIYEINSETYYLDTIEVWPENCFVLNYTDSKWDKAISFIENELKNWPDVYKVNQDTWSFSSRNQAEKFITVFNLKWEQ